MLLSPQLGKLELSAYLTEHPDVREEADVMVSNAMAEEASKTMLNMHGPLPLGGAASVDEA